MYSRSSIRTVLKPNTSQWDGHVVRMGNINADKVLVGKPLKSDNLEDRESDEKMLLEQTSCKGAMKMSLNGTGSGFVWYRYWAFGACFQTVY